MNDKEIEIRKDTFKQNERQRLQEEFDASFDVFLEKYPKREVMMFAWKKNIAEQYIAWIPSEYIDKIANIRWVPWLMFAELIIQKAKELESAYADLEIQHIEALQEAIDKIDNAEYN